MSNEFESNSIPNFLNPTRRDWLLGLAVAGLGSAIAPGFEAAAQTQAKTPRAGGILTIATSGDPPNFDPLSNTSSFALNVIAPCYNSLLMMDPLNPTKIIGDLAESWEPSADGRSYTFKLVKNAKFHDGTPLTSADVKATFDLARNPPAGVISARKSLLSAVSSIEAPDAYAVRFVLSRPSPSFISSLATGWFVVGAKHIIERDGDLKKALIGSGPFKLKTYARGVSIELERNPQYHVAGRPYLDGVKYFVIPDMGTSVSAFRTGQLLIHDGLSGNQWRQLQKDGADKFTFHSVAGYIGDPFTINTARKPFADIRVRKALALSIDRELAVKIVNDGDGVLGGLLPPTIWGLPAAELEKIPGYGKDVEANRAEAKRLLAEAGLATGFATSILARKAAGTHEPRAVFLADQFSRIGVAAKIEIQESATYFQTFEKRNFDIACNVVASLADDPDFFFGDYHTSNGGQNMTSIANAKVDELFLQQSQTTNVEERKKIVTEMERAALADYGTIILYFKKKVAVTSLRVNNYVMHPEPDNNRRMQEIWIS